jgi:hypothetical protein
MEERPVQAQAGPAQQERSPGQERTPEDQRSPEERDEKRSTEDRIRDLEAALAASRGAAPLNPIPENGAGEGIEVAETWSLFDQQRVTRAQRELL